MSEKRHKIKKNANYQNIIVRNSPALGRHVFVPSQNSSSQNHWSMVFDVVHMISMISTKIRKTMYGKYIPNSEYRNHDQ